MVKNYSQSAPWFAQLWINTIVNSATGCWEWQAASDSSGYGVTWDPELKEKVYVTRLVRVKLIGDIETRSQGNDYVLHTCDNPPCWNPAHLWVGTNADNLRDMAEKGRGWGWNCIKTHCPQGHAYDLTYLKNGKPARGCSICRKAAKQKYLNSEHGRAKTRAYDTKANAERSLRRKSIREEKRKGKPNG